MEVEIKNKQREPAPRAGANDSSRMPKRMFSPKWNSTELSEGQRETSDTRYASSVIFEEPTDDDLISHSILRPCNR
jgi:hypothetical protein